MNLLILSEPEVVEEIKKLIQVLDLNLNIEENTIQHYTSEYSFKNDAKNLVVRRGNGFNINIQFDRAYSKDHDDIRIVFETGEISH